LLALDYKQKSNSVLIIFYCVLLFFAIRLLILWIKRLREDRLAKTIEKEKVTTKINLNDFWNIIDASRINSKDINEQVGNLKNKLRELSETQIVEFDNRFIALKNKSYRWDLWGAIYLLRGGCSDDSFEYFREWLIGQGKDKFETAIKNPESIKAFVDLKNENWEGLGYCAQEVYREKTKKKYIPSDAQLKQNPTGEEWEEENLPKMFPSIWDLVK
jgi:hypothetical protein